ncbi:MAG: hypothetical protein ACRD43_15415, partial [Pyrinomonadaceae bacterium]
YDTYADVQAMKNGGVILKPGGTMGLPTPTVVGQSDGRGTSAEDYKRAKEYLDQLAVRTGGTIYEANTLGYLNNAFTRIASELREYYSLGFYPADVQEGKQRKLKVKVDKPDLAVRARDSYIVAKAKKRKYS